MTDRATPEARLLDAGWEPPERLRNAIERREALRSAIKGLKTRGVTDSNPIVDAIQRSDRDGIITAIVQDAIGQWLDRQCQNPDTDLTGWSWSCERELASAIYDNAGIILEALGELESPDAAAIVANARQALTADSHMVNAPYGQPMRPRFAEPTLSRTMVPR
jgi:hypothetical protein